MTVKMVCPWLIIFTITTLFLGIVQSEPEKAMLRCATNSRFLQPIFTPWDGPSPVIHAAVETDGPWNMASDSTVGDEYYWEFLGNMIRTRKFEANDTTAAQTTKYRCMETAADNKIIVTPCAGLLKQGWTIRMDPSMRTRPIQFFFSIVQESDSTQCIKYNGAINRLQVALCINPPTLEQLFFIDVDHFALIRELQGLQNFRVSNMLYSTLMSLCPKVAGPNTCPADG